jgi:uncharacterized membrane protein
MAFIFSENEEVAIIAAIQAAEARTSGEIRLHVEPHCKDEAETAQPDGDAFERALKLFVQLQMHRTKAQNGVLFYLAYESHKFAIVADVGINAKVPEDFWEHIKDNMQAHFKEKRFLEGIKEGIAAAGEALSQYFPADDKDSANELTDEISKS